MLPGCSWSARQRPQRSAPCSISAASCRPPSSCAGCSPPSPIPRRRGSARGPLPAGSRYPWRRAQSGGRTQGPGTLTRPLRRCRPMAIPDHLLAHVAPLGWEHEHIALTGDYVWADSNAISGFRPIRDVPAALLPRAAYRAVLNKSSADPIIAASCKGPMLPRSGRLAEPLAASPHPRSHLRHPASPWRGLGLCADSAACPASSRAPG
jgi:hypothetical protein